MVIVDEILEARRTDGVQRLPGGRQRVAGVLCTRGTLEKFDKNPKPAMCRVLDVWKPYPWMNVTNLKNVYETYPRAHKKKSDGFLCFLVK